MIQVIFVFFLVATAYVIGQEPSGLNEPTESTGASGDVGEAGATGPQALGPNELDTQNVAEKLSSDPLPKTPLPVDPLPKAPLPADMPNIPDKANSSANGTDIHNHVLEPVKKIFSNMFS